MYFITLFNNCILKPFFVWFNFPFLGSSGSLFNFNLKCLPLHFFSFELYMNSFIFLVIFVFQQHFFYNVVQFFLIVYNISHHNYTIAFGLWHSLIGSCYSNYGLFIIFQPKLFYQWFQHHISKALKDHFSLH